MFSDALPHPPPLGLSTPQEIYSFLEEICKTAPMRYVRQYLVQQGKLGPSLKHFKGLLYGLWFDLYGRKGRRDSCGFEHVFCGEEKPGNQVCLVLPPPPPPCDWRLEAAREEGMH